MAALLRSLIMSQVPLMKKFKTDLEQERISKSFEQTPSSLDESAKSVSKATEYRNEGNEAYGEGCYEQALEYYSRSVAAAPVGSEELALAYGNRSAALLALQRYEYALLDVNRALSEPSLPETKKEKYLARKTKCWKLIQAQEARKSELRNMLLKDGQDEGFNVGERLVLTSSQISIDQTDLNMNFAEIDDPIWNTKLDNAELPNVSSKVKLEQDPEWGLHWVATGLIEPGEVLLLQEYYSIKLQENVLTDYCAYCTLWCTALIPCPTCQQEMYCSVGCRQKAFDLYHRTECKMQPFLSELDVDFDEMLLIRTALRAFLRGTEQGSKLTTLMDNSTMMDMMHVEWTCADHVFSSDDYVSILNLPWTNLVEDSSDPLVIRKLDTIKFIFHAFWRIDFFGVAADESEVREKLGERCTNRFFSAAADVPEYFKKSTELTDLELFAALLLSHNVFVGRSANRPLCARISGGASLRTEIIDIGSGFGTLRSYMNQSCIPNTNVVSDKRRLLVYCSKTIKAGEQIFTSYEHANYLKTNKICRKKYLNEISKVCKCRACVEDWPGRHELFNLDEQYRTSSKMAIRKIESMNKTFWRWNGPNYEYKEDDLRQAFEFRKTYDKCVEEPSPTLFVCDTYIYMTMIARGNYYCSESVNRILSDYSNV